MSAAVQTCPARVDGYARREPETTVLHRVVSEHWPRFRERAEGEGGLPRFVVRDFEEYLRCGVLEHGVVHLACNRERLSAAMKTSSTSAVLAACYAASASDVQLLGAAPGRKTDKLVRPIRLVPSANEPLAEVGGVNVHAKVAVGAHDHPRRERLCRYLLRPPLAQDRLTLESDGRVRIAFKAEWKDGTHAVLLDPLDLIARLCALVPPPRFHLLRYHGVLAAHSAVRAHVVPGREPPSSPTQLPLFEASEAPLEPPPPPSRHPWPWLLRRVFGIEISICPVPKCGGRMRIVDIATTPDDVERVLGGQPARTRAPPPPPVSPAQLRLVFA